MTGRRVHQGGRIDRSTPVDFTWNGKPLKGYEGDTLASALMANGQTVLGRSFKYHRPRGIMSAGVEESGAIVTVGSGAHTEPNVRATTQELYSGLLAKGQNAWPSVRFDVGAVSGAFGRFFAAGFYYKTFMGLPPMEWGRGTGLWMKYEAIIRRAAGLGTASREPDPDTYDHMHGFCDVLVVGGGPAGLQAALTAATAGKDVVLVEQDFELGGDFLNDPATENDLDSLIQETIQAGVRILTRTTAFGIYDDGVVGLAERVTDHLQTPDPVLPRQRFWTMRTGAIVLATGALERSVAFDGNDRPGVMTAAAARVYLNRFGVLAGQNVVIATTNDSAYQTAHSLQNAGAVVTVLDARQDLPAMAQDFDVRTSHFAASAVGRHGVKSVLMAARDSEAGWQGVGDVDADLLLVSGGWSPVVNLASHRDVVPQWDKANACFVPTRSTEPIYLAGAAAGIWDRDACLSSGKAAANRALGKRSAWPKAGGWDTPISPVYEVKLPKQKSKAFVDPQHDVTSSDVRLAHQEGFVSVEHLKRYTTLGMATDQGKMGNIIGLALMAEALGCDVPEVGTTRFRPPYTPVAIGALAGRNTGRHFKPLRRTPLHEWNLAHGGTMTEAGLWHRPWYFARPGETIAEAYVREATTVRSTVGICDVSSLGKIAVQGPDAGEFLNRVYTNGFAKLPVGKARYGIMLRDDGMVMDDGTTWRLAEDEYLMTTTTAHAAKVMTWLEELLQLRWPDLRVHVTSVTDEWAGVSVAGPQSRSVIAACLSDPTAVTDQALPFMGVAKVVLADGTNALIARISFSGERAFELYVPAGQGPAMMDLLWPEAQKRHGCLYGLEALGTLRIEKGHVTGVELDGRMTIDDAGLGKMASTKKPFVGNVLRARPELMREDRPQLVGIMPVDHTLRFNSGSILCRPDKLSGFGEGWVTAVTHSPAIGHWIGLGYISGGAEAWVGQHAVATDPTRAEPVEVKIVSPHMFDPTGERMHG